MESTKEFGNANSTTSGAVYESDLDWDRGGRRCEGEEPYVVFKPYSVVWVG